MSSLVLNTFGYYLLTMYKGMFLLVKYKCVDEIVPPFGGDYYKTKVVTIVGRIDNTDRPSWKLWRKVWAETGVKAVVKNWLSTI